MSKKRKIDSKSEFVWNVDSPLKDILGYCDLKTLVDSMSVSMGFLEGVINEISVFRDFEKDYLCTYDIDETIAHLYQDRDREGGVLYVSSGVIELISKNKTIKPITELTLYVYSLIMDYYGRKHKLKFDVVDVLENRIIDRVVKDNKEDKYISTNICSMLLKYSKKVGDKVGPKYIKKFVTRLIDRKIDKKNIEKGFSHGCIVFGRGKPDNPIVFEWLKYWKELKKKYLKDLL